MNLSQNLKYKICSKCKKQKSIDEFHKRQTSKDGFSIYCKNCATQISINYYYNNNQKLIHADRATKRKTKIMDILNEIKKEHGCAFCSELEPVCLDFHHIDKKSKSFGLNSANARIALAKIIDEISKCEIVCSNCHRKIHAGILQITRPRKIDVSLLSELTLTKHHRISSGIKQINCIKCAERKQYISKSGLCRKCSFEKREKFTILEKDLKALVWQMPMIQIAKLFCVSDKTIVKKCKKFNISMPQRGYWLLKK